MVTNLLSFCISGNVFISPVVLKDSLSDIEFSVDSLFPSALYVYIILLPMACKDSAAKSAHKLFEDLLYVISHFSLTAFKSFSFRLSASDYGVSGYGFLCIYPCYLLSFLDVFINAYHQI